MAPCYSVNYCRIVITPRGKNVLYKVKLKQKQAWALALTFYWNFRVGKKMLLSRLAPRHLRRADVFNLRIVLGTWWVASVTVLPPHSRKYTKSLGDIFKNKLSFLFTFLMYFISSKVHRIVWIGRFSHVNILYPKYRNFQWLRSAMGDFDDWRKIFRSCSSFMWFKFLETESKH